MHETPSALVPNFKEGSMEMSNAAWEVIGERQGLPSGPVRMSLGWHDQQEVHGKGCIQLSSPRNKAWVSIHGDFHSG